MDERTRRLRQLRNQQRRRAQLRRRIAITSISSLLVILILVLIFRPGKSSEPNELSGSATPTPQESQKVLPTPGNDPHMEDTNQNLINFNVSADTVVAGTSRERIEFSHGPAKNQTVAPVVKQMQEELFSKYNAYAVDLETPAEEKVLYLTFDCGYEYEDRTAKCLDILKEKCVPAAFYLVGDFAKMEPDLTRRIIDEGHVVGNHSDGHEDFATLYSGALIKEVQAFDTYMKETFDYEATTFRFPSGIFSEYSLALINSFGYKTYFWSCAYPDWDCDEGVGVEEAMNQLKRRLHPGAYVLLHCVSADEPAVLSAFIDYARAEGYTFMPIPT